MRLTGRWFVGARYVIVYQKIQSVELGGPHFAERESDPGLDLLVVCTVVPSQLPVVGCATYASPMCKQYEVANTVSSLRCIDPTSTACVDVNRGSDDGCVLDADLCGQAGRQSHHLRRQSRRGYHRPIPRAATSLHGYLVRSTY
jgi:hypothetical protein